MNQRLTHHHLWPGTPPSHRSTGAAGVGSRRAVTAAGLGLLLAGAAAGPCQATLLAYEGFSYSAGASLPALHGGTGWKGGWVGVNGSSSVGGSGLLAGSNTPAGYDLRSAGNAAFVSSNSRCGRWLDCSPDGPFGAQGFLDGTGRIGADGKTLYVSFLQQPSSPNKFYEFEWHRGDLGDAGRIAGIGNDFNSTTVNLRAPNSAHTPLGWGSTQVDCYVVRIDFKAGNDDVYVYRNPARETESANEPVLTMLGVADMSFDGLALAAFLNGVTVSHDEIRLGETWGDVLGGGPEFVQQPTNRTAYLGQAAELVSVALSRQPVSYQWYRDGVALPGASAATLVLATATLSDAGSYWVVATNSLGAATSAVAELKVQALDITLPVQNLALEERSPLLVNASVGGAAPLALQWFKDGLALPGENNALLSRSEATVFDAGQYYLVATNAYGTVTSAVVNVSANLGGLLAYEGFVYPAGSGTLKEQNGGFGWSGVWTTIGGADASVLAASLAGGANAPANYDAHASGKAVSQPNASRSGRWLDCSAGGPFGVHGFVDANGNIGAANKTLYISFLQQPDGTSKFYELEFHRGDLGDPGRIAGVGNDTEATTVNFRAPDASQRSLGSGTTSVNCYVVRIDFKGGKDDVYVYRNPRGLSERANTPTLTLLGIGDMSFNGISCGAYLNGRTVKHDEIRLGMTWEDVTGNAASQLRIAERAEGQSRLQLAASPNYAYQIQAAPVAAGPWTNIARKISPPLGVTEVVETNRFESQRFFRAVAEPVLPVTESTDVVPPVLSRSFVVSNSLLNFPVKNGAAKRRVRLLVDQTAVRDFDIELADGAPDWWAVTDISGFVGQTATLTVDSLPPNSRGLSSVLQTNGIVGATNLYSETLRPQIHFSARRGWLNDANALVYYGGEYHLYYQHNPYGWNWGNMQWGHAVSPDLVRWQELPVAIYPHAYQDDVFSGSAIVDGANTSGFKTGTNDVIVAAYTSTGRGECIAFSNDRGRTFQDYANNPVVVHAGRDPHLLWYAPSNCWVMALYDETGGQGIAFYSSPDLRQWTYRSRINGFFECPDLFALPVDGEPANRKWVLNDASGGYMLGQFNGAVFTPETAKLSGNGGSAFYASQTYTEMPPGDTRKVRIGWAQIAMPGMPFNQMMYFPTELSLRSTANGLRLCSLPIGELTNLCVAEYAWTNLTVNPGMNPLAGIRGTLFSLCAQFTAGTAQEIDFTFQNQKVVYNPATQKISFGGKSNSLASVNGVVQLQILVDRDSIEIFGNNGQLYMPMPAGNPAGSSLLSLSCVGGTATFNALTVSKLRSAWCQSSRNAKN